MRNGSWIWPAFPDLKAMVTQQKSCTCWDKCCWLRRLQMTCWRQLAPALTAELQTPKQTARSAACSVSKSSWASLFPGLCRREHAKLRSLLAVCPAAVSWWAPAPAHVRVQRRLAQPEKVLPAAQLRMQILCSRHPLGLADLPGVVSPCMPVSVMFMSRTFRHVCKPM